MIKTRRIWAIAAAATILAALGTGLWFGDGPTTREGWEAASWAAGITAALALIVTVLVWTTTSTPPPGRDDRSDTVNTVNGNVSGGILIQGRDVHVDNPSYGGDHIDYRNGTFDGTIIGKQVNQPSPGAGNHGQEPNR